jgi:hypothetical protein
VAHPLRDAHHRKTPDLKVMSDFVIALDLFREQPVLTGQRVRLTPDSGRPG